MTPRLAVRYFRPGKQQQWSRMVRILAYTAQVHLPSWIHDIASVQVDETMSSPLGKQGNVWNTQKLDLWTSIVEAASDGERLLLLDADTAITRPLDAVWEGPAFDVAYTVKPKGSRFPLNGGVVFLVVSERTRVFMRAWRDKNRFFLENPLEYQVWSGFYGGINQAALGVLLRGEVNGLTARKLTCLEWNCEDEHWASFDPVVTRIVHYKSGIQRALFMEASTPEGAKPLVELWRGLEKAAMRARVEAPVVSPVSESDPNDEPVGPDADKPVPIDDQMVRPETLETPIVRPPLNRRQRRRAERDRTEMEA